MVTASRVEAAVPRLRLGIVGGGLNSFIGAVHLAGARLDDRYSLVAGALSSDPKRAKESAPPLRIPDERAYTSYEEMADKESQRADGIEVVVVVTQTTPTIPSVRRSLKPALTSSATSR
jgi:predicted dehydrogenase